MTEISRTPGHATNGQIADIIEELSPILQKHPYDHQLIALAAALIIRLDPDVDLKDLQYGTEILIRTAAEFVSDPSNFDPEWAELDPKQIN